MDLLKTIALGATLLGGFSISVLVVLATWQLITRTIRNWDTTQPLPPLTEIGATGMKFGQSVNAALDAVAKVKSEVQTLGRAQLITLKRMSILEDHIKKIGKGKRSK